MIAASIAIMIFIKLFVVLVTIKARKHDAIAIDAALLYGGMTALRLVVFPADGADWYYINAVYELIYIALLFALLGRAPITNMLGGLSLAAFALNAAAAVEYPTNSVAIYAVYPIIMQVLSLCELGVLLLAPTKAITDWPQLFLAMQIHEKRTGERRFTRAA